ncbi:hypothetical protein BCC0238_007339 (plasmid) [Burkholderia gladioli]
MHALRNSTSAAATVAAADRVTVSARAPPPVFPEPSPRGPPPANRRDRRPARNAQPGRNARIAPLERGDRHRRGRRPGHRQRPNAAAGFPTPSPRGPSPASRRDRRPARNIQLERNAHIARLERGGRHRRGRRPGHRQRSNAAAGSSMPSPRAEHPSRAQCAHCAARARRPPPSRPPAGPPPALEHCWRSSTAVAARAVGREPSRPPPRAERPARAQCTHCAARHRPPPPSLRPPWPPPALEHHHRFSRTVAAMGRPATSGAPRPIAEHPARCAARAAHDRRWRPPPARPPTPAPLRLPQRSRSSLRPRTVAPSTESAHRGRFPTYPPVPALHPFSTTNTVVENGARPTLLRCRSIAASVRTRGYVENLRGITTARAPNFQPDMHCLRSITSLPICRTADGSTCAFLCCFFSLCFRLCDAGKTSLCFNQANASAATKSHFGWLR